MAIVVPTPGADEDVWGDIVNKALLDLEAMVLERIRADLLTAKGDLLAASSEATPAALPAGTTGQRLQADTTQPTGLKWVDPTTHTLIDNKGDLLAGTSNDNLSRVAVGTDGQILTADSTQATGIKWGDAPAGGGGGGSFQAEPQTTMVYRTTDAADRFNTTKADDDTLVVNLGVGKYEIVAYVVFTASTTGDIKTAWSTTGGTVAYVRRGVGGPDLATDGMGRYSTHGITTDVGSGAAAAAAGRWLQETIVIEVSAGTVRLALQWAQNATDATTGTSVRSGSYIRVTKMVAPGSGFGQLPGVQVEPQTTMVYRTTDSAGRTTTTKADDDTLFVNLGVGKYEVVACIRYSASTTGDIRTAWATTGGTVGQTARSMSGLDTAATANIDKTRWSTHALSTDVGCGGPGSGGVWMTETLFIEVTAGTVRLALQWAQSVADAVTATFLSQGSYIRVTKMVAAGSGMLSGGILSVTGGQANFPAPMPGSMLYDVDNARYWHGIAVAGVNYWAPPPGSLVATLTRDADISPAAGATYVVGFDGEISDLYGCFTPGDTATQYKPTVPGWYQAHFTGVWATSQQGSRTMGVRRNGSVASGPGLGIYGNCKIAPSPDGGTAQTGMSTWLMNGTSDYIDLTAVHAASGPIALAFASMTVYYAGPA